MKEVCRGTGRLFRLLVSVLELEQDFELELELELEGVEEELEPKGMEVVEEEEVEAP